MYNTLLIVGGGSIFPVQLENGDMYDSFGDLYVNNEPIWTSNTINTKSTTGYAGGRLSAGQYWGIVSYREPNKQGKRVIKLFSKEGVDITKIKTDDDIPIKAYELPSCIPNPNHAGLPIVTFVQVHDGGTDWNWSHACLTVLNSNGDYNKLMKVTNDYDIMNVTLN